MKAVMLSIQPKWCELIASGKKTIEVRKTRPKLETPFKCYIYETKGRNKLIDITKDGDADWFGDTYHGKTQIISVPMSEYLGHKGGQMVVGEFVCDSIYDIDYSSGIYKCNTDNIGCTCLTLGDVIKYGNSKTLYAWHISDLKIYDKPKELGEFTTQCKYWGNGWGTRSNNTCIAQTCNYRETSKFDEFLGRCTCNGNKKLTRPFQSWGYVEEASNDT